MLIYEPLEHCCVCDAPADVLDDAAVPYCARCYDAELRRERAEAEREAGYETGHGAASDMEVRR